MMRRYRIIAMLLAAVLLLVPPYGIGQAASGAGQLSVGLASGYAGTVVTVPVTLRSEGSVAALQFRLTYDASKLELLAVHKGGDLAGSYQLIAGLESGKVVVGSLGGAAIGAGSKTVAIAEFRISNDAEPGNYAIGLDGAAFTDMQARSLASGFQLAAGEVQVRAVDSGYVPVTGVALSPQALALTAGGASGRLQAMVAPAGATNAQVSWQSSNPLVAQVIDGVITPLTVGTAMVTATTADGGFTATATVTVGASGGAPGGPVAPPDTEPSAPELEEADSAVDVLVNGQREPAGRVIVTTVNNRSSTKIVLDEEKLEARLAAEGQGAVITIPVDGQSAAVSGELNGRMVHSLEQKQAVVSIQTDHASYTLPAAQINIQALAAQFGDQINLADITVAIEISSLTEEAITMVEDAGNQGGWTLLAPPLQFTVTGYYGEASIKVTQFDAYVERMIAIPPGIDPARVATALVMERDGTSRHVPTRVIEQDGQYYAVISSLTNSTYALVAHTAKFSDIAGHWAEAQIGDMGARMILGGKGAGRYQPDDDISRAEFAAIVVRGLGLKLADEASEAQFRDVKSDDWYYGVVHTAYEHGLINGYTDDTFRPNERISREQAMTIIAKAMEITGLRAKLPAEGNVERLQAFSDREAISYWARGGVADSVQAGIVTGRTVSLLSPQAPMTRAEVAVIVQRLLLKTELIG